MNERQLQFLAATHVNDGPEDDLNFLWLKKEYPLPRWKASFSESLPAFLIFVGSIGLGVVCLPTLYMLLEVSEFTMSIARTIWVGLMVAGLAYFIYKFTLQYNLHKASRYYIHKGSIRFRKGIFNKSLNSFPLSQITDIYSLQAWYQAPFGLCDLIVSTANSESQKKAYIRSLPLKNAQGMTLRVTKLAKLARMKVESRSGEALTDAIEGWDLKPKMNLKSRPGSIPAGLVRSPRPTRARVSLAG